MNLTLEMIKVLFLRFSTIFGERFSGHYKDPAWFDMWCEDWLDGLAGIQAEHIKLALDHCKLNLQWSPSIAEFRSICEKYAGMPSMQEVLQAAIRGDFAHPLARICYDKVGSWDMKNMSAKDLNKRFGDVYRDELANLRMSQYRQHKLETDKKITQLHDASRDANQPKSTRTLTNELRLCGEGES